MAIAFVLLTSMTSYLFLVVFTFAYLKEKREPIHWLVTLVVALGVAAGFYVYRDRIVTILSAGDASVLMRFSSARTAMDVIAQSFPVGVGYGNFQQFARYTDPFVILGLQQGTLDYYKSDMFLLNVVAELGVFGVLFVLGTGRVFLCRRHRLPLIYFLVLMVAAGTILIQATLVLAAVVGMLDRQSRIPSVGISLDQAPIGRGQDRTLARP